MVDLRIRSGQRGIPLGIRGIDHEGSGTDIIELAGDAAALVELDVRPLPAVLEPRAGLEPGAPKARLDCPDNLVAHWVVEYGDVERAFAGAGQTFRITFNPGTEVTNASILFSEPYVFDLAYSNTDVQQHASPAATYRLTRRKSGQPCDRFPFASRKSGVRIS